MQLKILINLDNAAFASETQVDEIDCALAKLASKIGYTGGIQAGWSSAVFDSNGNRVGEASVCD